MSGFSFKTSSTPLGGGSSGSSSAKSGFSGFGGGSGGLGSGSSSSGSGSSGLGSGSGGLGSGSSGGGFSTSGSSFFGKGGSTSSSSSSTKSPGKSSTGFSTKSSGSGFSLGGLGGGGGFGSTQTQSKVQIDRKTTFENLPEKWQQEFHRLQVHILKESKMSEEVKKHSYQQVHQIERTIADLKEQLRIQLSTVVNDNKDAVSLKEKAQKEMRHAERGAQCLELMQSPMYSQQRLFLPSPYFWDMLDSFKERMQMYHQQICEIDDYLHSPSSQRTVYTPQMLRDIMQAQYELFMSLASRIAEIHNYIAEMKEKYDVAGGSSRDSENNGRKANDGRTGYPNPYSSSTSSAYLPDLYGDRFSETTKTEKARIKLPPPVVVAAVQTAEQQKAAASGQGGLGSGFSSLSGGGTSSFGSGGGLGGKSGSSSFGSLGGFGSGSGSSSSSSLSSAGKSSSSFGSSGSFGSTGSSFGSSGSSFGSSGSSFGSSGSSFGSGGSSFGSSTPLSSSSSSSSSGGGSGSGKKKKSSSRPSLGL